MYIESRSGATLVACLHLFQLGVALDEFLRAASRETDGKASVFVVTLDADDRADAEIRVANLPTQKGVRVGAASHGRSGERARSGGPARRRPRNRLTPHTAEDFLGPEPERRSRSIAPPLP